MNISRRNFLEGLGLTASLGVLAGCGGGSAGGEGGASDTPMVVGYSPFSSKFSPFFAETAYDQDAQNMTQLALYPTTRLGEVVYKGIEGETYEYNGTDYTYYGPADIEVTENPDGTVFYDITLRDDITYSDGEPLTIDDVIFNTLSALIGYILYRIICFRHYRFHKRRQRPGKYFPDARRRRSKGTGYNG